MSWKMGYYSSFFYFFMLEDSYDFSCTGFLKAVVVKSPESIIEASSCSSRFLCSGRGDSVGFTGEISTLYSTSSSSSRFIWLEFECFSLSS